MNGLEDAIDFRNGVGFSRLAALTLDLVADRFRDEFGRRLATLLGGEPAVTRKSVTFQRGSVFTSGDWSTCVAYCLETHALPAGYALLLIRKAEMLGLCQAVFGITPEAEEAAGATPLEQVAEEMILRYLCQTLDLVWGGVAPGPWQKVARENRIGRLERFDSRVEYAAWEFNWEHPVCRGMFGLVVERSLARKIARPASSSLPTAPQPKMLEANKIRGVPVPVSVQLGVASLTMAEIRSLEVGDIVLLDQKVDDAHLAIVGGLPKLFVKAGRKGLRNACQLKTFVTDDMSVKAAAS